MLRKTEAYIDLDAIRANLALAGSLAPQSQSIPVIKANAYGHGMRRVAAALQDRAPAFAVATLDEALELRADGIPNTLLVLQGVTGIDACREAAAHQLTPIVHAQEQVDHLLAADVRLPVWLKVDTGMHRLGIAPPDCRDTYRRLVDAGNDVQVVCTHFACADEPDNDATARQIECFASATRGLDVPRSLANSAGIMAWPSSHAEWNRPGYMLYGNSPLPGLPQGDDGLASGLRPAMTLKSEIISIREVPTGESVGYGARWTASRPSVIGTVAIGYGDGYPRHAANGTPTWVNGRVAPLAGTVSMDAIAIDLTQHERIAVGDRVELWGNNVSLNEVADKAGTIGLQLVTGVSNRVPRVYVETGASGESA